MGLCLVDSFKEANNCDKLAFIFLLIAEILGWIAFTTTEWGRMFLPSGDPDYFSYGLWRVCESLGCYSNEGLLLEWFRVVRTFAILGFVTLNLGFFLVILSMYSAPCKCNSDLSLWNFINCFFGAICWLAAVVIFGVDFNQEYDFGHGKTLSYSFILAIITLNLMVAASCLILLPSKFFNTNHTCKMGTTYENNI